MKIFENLQQLTTNEVLNTIKKLVLKKALTLKNMKDAEKLITLCLASRCIPEQPITEPEANLALLAWLNHQGSMLRVDHIELRRTLIDLDFWSRDSAQALYHRKILESEHFAYAYMQSILKVDIQQYIIDIKISEEKRRLENMKKFSIQ